jgi:hypothetical protein
LDVNLHLLGKMVGVVRPEAIDVDEVELGTSNWMAIGQARRISGTHP